jgi:predicted Zn-dependent protease
MDVRLDFDSGEVSYSGTPPVFRSRPLTSEREEDLRQMARDYPHGGRWSPVTKDDLQRVLGEVEKLRAERKEALKWLHERTERAERAERLAKRLDADLLAERASGEELLRDLGRAEGLARELAEALRSYNLHNNTPAREAIRRYDEAIRDTPN